MREILFRGKRTDNGEWVYGYFVKMLWEYSIIPLEDENTVYPVVLETIGQYTGVTDKNGRKIFEGDIVSCPSNVCRPLFNYDTARETYIYEVVYQDELTAFVMENKDKQPLVYEYLLLSRTVDKCEVVGNIFDNPELLSRG